jgi:hypothetical protein
LSLSVLSIVANGPGRGRPTSAESFRTVLLSEEIDRMTTRRRFLASITCAVVAVGVVAGSVLADELLGVITKVDIEGKKLTVVEKDTDKEVIITVDDKTEVVTKNGTDKVDLEKISKGVEKAKEKGQKGAAYKITHEKGVASKLQRAFAKKAAN